VPAELLSQFCQPLGVAPAAVVSNDWLTLVAVTGGEVTGEVTGDVTGEVTGDVTGETIGGDEKTEKFERETEPE
jgi:hypothetical protein